MRQISESALEENIVRKILDKCGPLDLKGKNCCRGHKMFELHAIWSYKERSYKEPGLRF